MSDIARSFQRDGFALVPGVLSPERVAALRDVCSRRLVDDGTEEMLPQEFLAEPELIDVMLGKGITQVLKEIFGGTYALYPNLTVRKSLYVGWHVDDAFIGAGREYVWDQEFQHVQGAFYLQPNDPVTGGGIDVVPGSHRFSFDGYGRTENHMRDDLPTILSHHESVRIPSQPGDLVLWHARLLHSSTPATLPGTPAPDGNAANETKFGLFFSAGRDDAYENNRYLSNLVSKRIVRVKGEQRIMARHAALLDIRFPADYPEAVVARMKELAIAAATF